MSISVKTSRSGRQRIVVPVFLRSAGAICSSWPFFPTTLPFFEVQVVAAAVAPDGHVHVFGSVLRGAGAQAVEAQGVFVIAAVGVLVLAAGVELAKDQLPVEALLDGVPVQRAAAAEVLHLDRAVLEGGQGDLVAVALARLIDGVGEDLENGMLAAVQPVRAEDDARALADAVGALELGDAVVAVGYAVFCHKYYPFTISCSKIETYSVYFSLYSISQSRRFFKSLPLLFTFSGMQKAGCDPQPAPHRIFSFSRKTLRRLTRRRFGCISIAE